MSTDDSNKDLILITSAVVILIFLGWFFIFSGQTLLKSPKSAPAPESLPVITPAISPAPAGQAAEGLPSNLPLNGKTEIAQSYNATYPNSTAKQTTVIFKSSKTPKENYDFYAKWGQDNGWQIVNQSDEETLKSLYLKKATEDINITITKESINISYVKF